MIFGVNGKQIQKSEQIFLFVTRFGSASQRHIRQELCILVDGFNYVEGFLSVVGFMTSCNSGIKS